MNNMDFDEEEFKKELEIEMLNEKINKMNKLIHDLIDLIMDSGYTELMDETLHILVHYPR